MQVCRHGVPSCLDRPQLLKQRALLLKPWPTPCGIVPTAVLCPPLLLRTWSKCATTFTDFSSQLTLAPPCTGHHHNSRKRCTHLAAAAQDMLWLRRRTLFPSRPAQRMVPGAVRMCCVLLWPYTRHAFDRSMVRHAGTGSTVEDPPSTSRPSGDADWAIGLLRMSLQYLQVRETSLTY